MKKQMKSHSQHLHKSIKKEKKQPHAGKNTKKAEIKGGSNHVKIENLKAHHPMLRNFQFQKNEKPLSRLQQNNKKKEGEQKFVQPKKGQKAKKDRKKMRHTRKKKALFS